MVAPYAAVYERDESGYINTEQTINVFIASEAPCGPVGTRLVPNSKTFYKKYTPDGAYKSGYPVAFLNAQAIFDINSPVYFTRVIPEDALYGGAVVTIGNQVPSYSLQAGLASPDSFVFADPLENATKEKVSIFCKADTNGNLGGTYFILPNKQEYVYLKNTARAEVAQITCTEDSAGSLNNTYFILPQQNYYVWFNVDSTGTDPGSSALTLLGKTGIEIALSANSTANAVAATIDLTLENNTDVTSEVNENILILTSKKAGVIAHGNSGTSGFSYTTAVLGVDASKDVTVSGLTGYEATITAGATADAIARAIKEALSNSNDFTADFGEETFEKVTITCAADADGSLNSTYFILPQQHYYVWLDVNGAGVDPATTEEELENLTGIKVSLATNATATDVASAINSALENNDDVTATTNENALLLTSKKAGIILPGNEGNTGFAYEITTIGGNNNVVIIEAINVGYMNDIEDGNPATTFVFTTIVQGSTQSGSETLLFYTSDPNSLDISFKIYSHQDHPEKAIQDNTFIVEVYKDNILETSITCSRIRDMKDGNGQPLYVETAMEASNYLRCRDNIAIQETEQPASITTALKVTGGSAGSAVTTGDMTNATKEWANKDDFDITLMLTGGWTDPAYAFALDNIAKTRGDCCVINSIPYYIENYADYMEAIKNFRRNTLNLNTSYTATFSSNLQVYNSNLNKNVYIPSDGHIAGAIINASRNYEIYYPILGFKRGILNNVLDVKRRYTKEEMDALYDIQINPIRFIPGRGIVIWGQKTMQAQSSSLDRLNARLLLCSIKPALQQFLEEQIGELNTDTVRDAIVLKLSGLFDQLIAKQGILAYEVNCDPIDPNDPNKLSVQVKLQITPSVEFVELTITLTPVGVEFS